MDLTNTTTNSPRVGVGGLIGDKMQPITFSGVCYVKSRTISVGGDLDDDFFVFQLEFEP